MGSLPIGQRGCQSKSSTFEILFLLTVSDIRISEFVFSLWFNNDIIFQNSLAL